MHSAVRHCLSIKALRSPASQSTDNQHVSVKCSPSSVVYLYFGPAAAPGTRGSRRDVLSPRVCVKGCENSTKRKTMDKYGTSQKIQ
jgi:hypothetical protein